jgi:hypothetical protein
MKVLAAPGLQCPKEDKPREYIPDTGDGIDVPETPFYLRLIGDGSLVLAPESNKKGGKK